MVRVRTADMAVRRITVNLCKTHATRAAPRQARLQIGSYVSVLA